jgi:hypothetical protein
MSEDVPALGGAAALAAIAGGLAGIPKVDPFSYYKSRLGLTRKLSSTGAIPISPQS